MKKIKKFFYILLILQLCCILFFACNKTIEEDNSEGMKDPRFTSITAIEQQTKKYYSQNSFKLRVFNPTNVINTLEINTLLSDSCTKKTVKTDYSFFLDSDKLGNFPSYICGNCGISDFYYDAVYKEITNIQTMQSLYPNCSSFSYLLDGFSFDIIIKKNDEIFLSSLENNRLSTLALDNNSTFGGWIDADFANFIEGNDFSYDGNSSYLNKWARYQANGSYNNVSYMTCSVIIPNVDSGPSFIYIKNIIKVDEQVNGYNITYFICERSTVDLKLQHGETVYIESMEAILTPLRQKTIDMAQSFIDHSLDYLNR